MAIYSTDTFTFLAGLMLVSSLTACAGAPATQDAKGSDFPVTWTQELGMPNLLDQAQEVNTQADLARMLELPWYASITVEASILNKSQALGSCNDYFAVKTTNLRAQTETEHTALLELMIMCEATKLLSQASPAKQSNIPPQPLSANLPDELPKSVALITSQSEQKRITDDAGISTWGDVNVVNTVEQPSAHQIEFHSDAGLQTLSVLGRGDFSEDGREDLLVVVEDTVEGGSYVNLRLFVLTVTEQGEWQVAAEQ